MENALRTYGCVLSYLRVLVGPTDTVSR